VTPKRISPKINNLLASVTCTISRQSIIYRAAKTLQIKSLQGFLLAFKASHYQIADELATSRVVISRLLKILENNGKILLYRNEIKLLQDFDA
jgi:CRP-like cAMP-binding protein